MKRKRSVCSACGQAGHNRNNKNCSKNGQNLRDGGTTATRESPEAQAEDNNKEMLLAKLDSVSLLYMLFDIETIGFNRETDDIVEICALAVKKNGEAMEGENNKFYSLVKPKKKYRL